MFQFPAFASFTLFYSGEDTYQRYLETIFVPLTPRTSRRGTQPDQPAEADGTAREPNKNDFPSTLGGFPHSEIYGSKGIRTSP
jgi:hypothetical protein